MPKKHPRKVRSLMVNPLEENLENFPSGIIMEPSTMPIVVSPINILRYLEYENTEILMFLYLIYKYTQNLDDTQLQAIGLDNLSAESLRKFIDCDVETISNTAAIFRKIGDYTLKCSL